MNHIAIVVPGLGDNISFMELSTKHWKKKNIQPIIFHSNWKDKKESFEKKLSRLLKIIDAEVSKGNRVSLIGTSAGASLCYNAFYARKDKLGMLVNVCGRIRIGKNSFPSLEIAAKNSNAFFESVTKCEKGFSNLTGKDKLKIMNLYGAFDETVPKATSLLDGAKNMIFVSCGHILNITLALTFYSSRIFDFIYLAND
jgi:hypothetical protein